MKAVIYARFSSDRQREESVEGQIRECKEYAQRENISIVTSILTEQHQHLRIQTNALIF